MFNYHTHSVEYRIIKNSVLLFADLERFQRKASWYLVTELILDNIELCNVYMMILLKPHLINILDDTLKICGIFVNCIPTNDCQ